jgi:hypothetical protein
MSHEQDPAEDDAMRREYDFTNAVRGKYYQRYQQGTNVVVLEPDVASAFPTAESVNDALRSLLRLAKRSTGAASRARRPRTKAAQAG